MSHIRVLQVIPTLRCGGAERMVVNLMTHLEERRFHAAAIVLGRPEGGPLEQTLREGGFPVWYLDKKSGVDPNVLFRLRRVAGRFRPHVVHSHLCLHYVFPSLAGGPGAGHVTTAHLPGDTRHSRLVLPLTRLAFRRGVIPVAVSAEVAAWLKRVCALRSCQVIPNGIPLADYQRPAACRAACRIEQGLTDEDVAFVCVARLEQQKNHAMLLDAFARALAREPRAHLWIVGDGACRTGLELRASALRLHGKVRFLGQRADVARILAAADVFVLPSHNEGNPLSLMEAMAAGLPVVATAVGGVPELIENDRSGLLVRPRDCDALGSAMVRVLRNARLRRTLGACAAERASDTFSASRMAHAYMELYERMMARGARASAGCHFEMATH
jgi:glycosyltransferase involved in cell wall biosynthesis